MFDVRNVLFIPIYWACLFTVAHAIKVQSVSEAMLEAEARHIRQAPETTTASAPSRDKGPGVFGNESFIFDTSCLRMETKGVNIQTKKSEAVNWDIDEDISNATYAVSGGEDCGNTTDLTVTFSNFPLKFNITGATFTMLFKRDIFSWWITNISLSIQYHNGTSDDSSFEGPLHTQDIGAGVGYAYMCQDQYIFLSGYLPGQIQAGLLFDDLILQPFIHVTNGSYGQLEPCEYAFTIPLWMAIITGLIMSVILALGISMLASIKTPDRFDDPKTSKLLSVPNE